MGDTSPVFPTKLRPCNQSWLWSRLQTTRVLHEASASCSRVLSNLPLPWKNRVALKIFTVLDILFTFRIFNNLCLPWKQSFPWNFTLYWIYFLPFRIFEQLCAFPEKQRVPWIHSTDNIFFIIQDFWATCACPEKQSCREIFHCIEYTFCIQEFWATCACPEKQRVP